jgi:hypothetical protein
MLRQKGNDSWKTKAEHKQIHSNLHHKHGTGLVTQSHLGTTAVQLLAPALVLGAGWDDTGTPDVPALERGTEHLQNVLCCFDVTIHITFIVGAVLLMRFTKPRDELQVVVAAVTHL